MESPGMPEAIFAFIVGVFISVCYQLIVNKPKTLIEIISAGAKSVIVGIASHLAITSYGTSVQLSNINDTLETGSSYRTANSFVEDLSDPELRRIFADRMHGIDTELNGVVEGSLTINRNDVFDTWGDLFDVSDREVRATNVVNESDWALFGPDSAGINVQQGALRRINITRVMIYDPSVEGHREGLRRTLCYQRDRLGSGFRGYEISLARLQQPPFEGWRQALGSDDIVIYDDKCILVTITDENTRTINFAKLIVDRNMVSEAQQFYSRLLEEAKFITDQDCINY